MSFCFIANFSPYTHTHTHKSGIVPGLFQSAWAISEKGWAPTSSFLCLSSPTACHFSKQMQFDKGSLLWAFYFRGEMNNCFPFFFCSTQTPLHLHIMQTSRRKQLACRRTSIDNTWAEQSVAVSLVSRQAH